MDSVGVADEREARAGWTHGVRVQIEEVFVMRQGWLPVGMTGFQKD
jgi:hypothetical protein